MNAVYFKEEDVFCLGWERSRYLGYLLTFNTQAISLIKRNTSINKSNERRETAYIEPVYISIRLITTMSACTKRFKLKTRVNISELQHIPKRDYNHSNKMYKVLCSPTDGVSCAPALSHSDWPFTCVSLSLTHTAWHKRRGEGRRSACVWRRCVCVSVREVGVVTHRAAMNMTQRYSIVRPCPVPRTSDSISVSGINVSLGWTFWIIGAVCRHAATSCQQPRLSVLSHSLSSCASRKQAVLATEHLIIFLKTCIIIIITKPFP